MLTEDMIDWFDEPETIHGEEIEAGMVLRYELGDFGNMVERAVLYVEDEGSGFYRMEVINIGDELGESKNEYTMSHETAELLGRFDIDDIY